MLTGFAVEHFAWSAVIQRLMRAHVIVKRQPFANVPARLGHRTLRFDIHLYMFQTSPQPLDEDIVQIPPLAIHADLNAPGRQLIEERGAGELPALIGVEY